MQRYDPATIEPKWQKIWAKTKLYEVSEDDSRRKVYATPMLPYPSGEGLHVGHVRNYSIADAVARYHRQQGKNVMSNMGWDSFGLPAENYAIKTGIPPWETIATNVKRFKTQLMRLGISYDWSREINTSDPDYYRWTQWIFLQLFKHDLAYQAENWQWWCPKCKTVLANEQVINGCCWRHEDTEVSKKLLKQWFFKITDYADELLDATDDLDWPEHIKTMQKNWIGRSDGAEIKFAIQPGKKTGAKKSVTVFTTRPDTLYGATFLVLAPEHPLVSKLTVESQKSKVERYVKQAQAKSDIERQETDRDKTGIDTGATAINPVSGEPVPVWIADYVLMGYGTGAIMAVPAHDERDYAFAQTYKLAVVPVIQPPTEADEECYSGEGQLINSDKYNGLDSAQVREDIVANLAQQKLAAVKTNYKIRDWLISRQRYWGAPIPIIHCDKCGAVPVPEADLPVELPKVENFAPTGATTSVLAGVEDWVNVACPACEGPAKRETDTMDGYACSSWYMLRYTDPHNNKQAWDPAKANYWLPVDYYFGGDHAVSHLLYFRFWQRFFARQGWVDEPEPVKRLVFNGYIYAADGTKMSKSKGNVVDPLEVVDSGYGADALRLFELFAAPYDQDVAWNPRGVPGTHRFLQRVWTLVNGFVEAAEADEIATVDNQAEHETRLLQAIHRTTKKVTDDMERLSFNTAIAAMMEFTNTANQIAKDLPFGADSDSWRTSLEMLLSLLAPFAPHISEELWSMLGHDQSIHIDSWPAWDEDYIKAEMLSIVVQVDGRLRANIEVPVDTPMAEQVKIAKLETNVANHLKGKTVSRTVEVPGRLINFVTK